MKHSITRVYKNAAGDTIGIESLVVSVNQDSAATQGHGYLATVDHQTFLGIQAVTAQDRVVAKIKLIADYVSKTDDSGDFLTYKFLGHEDDTSTARLDLTGTVYVIGNTLP